MSTKLSIVALSVGVCLIAFGIPAAFHYHDGPGTAAWLDSLGESFNTLWHRCAPLTQGGGVGPEGEAAAVREENCEDSKEESRCRYGDVEELNHDRLLPLLQELVRTPFFRYFKVNLYCDCPFWPEDGMCSLQACSVCECEQAEVPPPWLAQEQQQQQDDCSQAVVGLAERQSVVNSTVDGSERSRLLNLPRWFGLDNPWLPEQDGGLEYQYINLLDNPERFTGYAGDHAHRIWDAIYKENCFRGINDIRVLGQCEEVLVFYRLISGVHASISAHIAGEYLLDEPSNLWGTNLQLFRERLGVPEKLAHVENLYFAYLFVLRAVVKAAPYLEDIEYATGLPNEDKATQHLVQQLTDRSIYDRVCAGPFNSGRLWKGEQGQQLKNDLQAHFQNITRLMDCVGCDKCRLWGKLQLLGMATALKIMFNAHDCTGTPPAAEEPFSTLSLERNEVIALLNLLHRLSESVEIYRSFSEELLQHEGLSRSLQPERLVS